MQDQSYPQGWLLPLTLLTEKLLELGVRLYKGFLSTVGSTSPLVYQICLFLPSFFLLLSIKCGLSSPNVISTVDCQVAVLKGRTTKMIRSLRETGTFFQGKMSSVSPTLNIVSLSAPARPAFPQCCG